MDFILKMLSGSDYIDSGFTFKLSDFLLELDSSITTVNTFGASITDIWLSNPNVYIDSTWQNVVIKLDDKAEGFVLEVDFVRFGDTL